MDVGEVIIQALTYAKIVGYKREYTFLGRGVGNNTYKILIGQKAIVLRVAISDKNFLLEKEYKALMQLGKIKQTPKLLYFNTNQKINDRLWILESFIEGTIPERLNLKQFESLGALLRKIHTKGYKRHSSLNTWEHFLDCTKTFGDEAYFLKHPDPGIATLCNTSKKYMINLQTIFNDNEVSLIHSDATISNMLVVGDSVRLIDWEFARISDPMRDFSTIYYDDIDYNTGKWRIKISPQEKSALFKGYTNAGGKIDINRILFWMNFDKLGATLFLYWRIFQSLEPLSEEFSAQLTSDLQNLKASLFENMN